MINIDVVFLVDSDQDFSAYIYTDSLRLQQVIANPLNNAFKCTHKGQVRLSMRRIVVDDVAKMKIIVADTGIGIAEDQQEKLFLPFRQAGDSTSRKYRCTGLGLAICKQIVQAMGGTVNVSSRLGEGSRFSSTSTLEVAPYVEECPQEKAELIGYEG